MRKTKIICTMGPATDDPAVLEALIQNGMNVARFNFSHGNHEEQKARLEKLKAARLFGVASDDIAKPQNGLGADFTLKDLDHPEKMIRVTYRGVLPDTFEKGSEVILEGRMDGPVFHAKTLMTKCPSKYEKANRDKA